MQIRICFVYPWATFGGCERVLINRALAFKQYFPEMLIDFYFMHDSGGGHAFRLALKKYELEDTTSIVTSLDRNYDLVSLIDCPQAIELCQSRSQRYIVECHTGYKNNREYLHKLPPCCEQVIVPSLSFKTLIENEVLSLPTSVSLLRNFVPWDINSFEFSQKISLPEWKRKPILFFGRLDHLKDPLSILNAFQLLESRRKGEFMLLICGPKTPEIDIEKELLIRSLDNISLVLPPVSFTSSRALLNSIANSGGIFVSPSQNESFGLSAAEALSSNIPVALSDIKAHLDLVSGHESILTYPLGDTEKFSKCIENLFDHYDVVREAVTTIRNTFSTEVFLEDWKKLMEKLGITI